MLKLVGLRKQFGELVAVNDIDLTVEEGEIRGLIGPNGSGKTTLFNLITGFIRPTRGKVIWHGRDITGQSPHAIVKKGIARTFQLTTLFKDMTALQNVVIACNLHAEIGLFQQFFRAVGIRKLGIRRKERAIEEKAVGLLETVGIADVKDEIAGELPHGHQRALGIAIALATESKLLLLDEPVTGMNPIETRDVMDKIKMLRERGITILLVEHDMRAVMTTCGKITVMNFGKKIAEGTPEELSKHKEVIEAYLGKG
jgi:branched-chain amino acid transport system ATP-binding protein